MKNLKVLIKSVLCGMLLFSESAFAHLIVYNDTKNFLYIEAKPSGTTQYTKSCRTQSFKLRSQEQYQLSDVQGSYPCPDIHIQIRGETDPHPTQYEVKVNAYDFEGSLGSAPLGDTTIYIVQDEAGKYHIKVVNQPPK